MSSTHRLLVAASLLLSFGSGCASCAQRGVGVIEGPINDPSNRTLRRDMLALGASQFCAEAQKHSAPLKMSDDQPVTGRFFPRQCATKVLDNGDLSVTVAGEGYAWTNMSRKVTFGMTAAAVYNQDFLMDGSTLYAYFRTRPGAPPSSTFQSRIIELASGLSGISLPFVGQLSAPVTAMADNFGRQLVAGELQKGFTVIREPDGTADFGLGVVEKGTRPAHPFNVHGSSRITYENTRVEVHQNQRDFVGPIVIEESDRAVYLTATLDGAPAIDVLYMRQSEGEGSLRYYLDYPQAGPLAGAPMVSEVLQAGMQYTRALPLPKGTYYLVFDNSSAAGQVNPVVTPLDDRAAVVSYVLQLGDAP